MDGRMPVMDGLEATRRIREAERLGGLPRTVVIGLTASAFDHDRARILEAGCDDVVMKPFQEAALFDALKTHLRLDFVYEDGAPEPAPRDGALTRERMAALPEPLREKLKKALLRGDADAASLLVRDVDALDPELSGSLQDAVSHYRIEEVLTLLE
jgi:two-component system sensor histidine kinase/response regulator